MIHCPDSVIWFDDHFIDCDFIDKNIFEEKTTVYEVFRVINGIPLFLDVHLQRLNQSLVQIGVHPDAFPIVSTLPGVISRLIELADIQSRNIEIALVFSRDLNLLVHSLVYTIASHYPNEELYNTGARTMVYFAARENPSAKVKDQPLREAADIIIKKRNLFEVVLVDKYGRITEGSRTNIFFVKGDALFTAPDRMVLKGITREKVFDICHQHGITVNESPIAYDKIESMDAAFLTGTSPKVLPVSALEDTTYPAHNLLVRSIMAEYDQMINRCTISFKN